jgi:hypothetical protein
MTPDLPRRYKARYGASIAIEIRKSVTLQVREEFLYSQSFVNARISSSPSRAC